MKFLIISDLHGNIEILDKLDKEFEAADAVLFAGDFARFGKIETAKPALEALCKKHEVIFSVIGNCDSPDFINEIEAKDISIQNSISSWNGLTLAGCGGGTKFKGDTPNERTEEEIIADLHLISDMGNQIWNNLVLIMHNPPKNTACDCVGNDIHVGSEVLRSFIETYSPSLVVTGHIHEGIAIDKIQTANGSVVFV